MMKAAIVTLALLLAAVPVALNAQGRAAKPAAGTDAAIVRELDGFIRQGMKDWEVPGLSVAVVHGDSVLLVRGYGVRSLGSAGAVDEQTLFGMMSTTKAMTTMALAMLVPGFPSGVMGEVDEDWRAILSGIVAERRLSAKQLGFVGLRSVDPGEQRRMASLPEIFITTMQDVDRYGIERVLHGMDDWLRSTGARALWISFDVDVLDPVLAPGTGTTVRGGLSYRESHLCGELLRKMLDEPGCPFKLVGLDLVETNPLIDTNNETAKVVVEWVASLFGKTILGQVRSSPL
jgi:hypothetical protein